MQLFHIFILQKDPWYSPQSEDKNHQAYTCYLFSNYIYISNILSSPQSFHIYDWPHSFSCSLLLPLPPLWYCPQHFTSSVCYPFSCCGNTLYPVLVWSPVPFQTRHENSVWPGCVFSFSFPGADFSFKSAHDKAAYFGGSPGGDRLLHRCQRVHSLPLKNKAA